MSPCMRKALQVNASRLKKTVLALLSPLPEQPRLQAQVWHRALMCSLHHCCEMQREILLY